MNIKFWKEHGGYVLVKNIWHMESSLGFIKFYTDDNREFMLYRAINEDGTEDPHIANLEEIKTVWDIPSHDYVGRKISNERVSGWIAVHSDEEMESLV